MARINYSEKKEHIYDPVVGLNVILYVAQVSCERAALACLLEQNNFAVTFVDTCEQALDLLRSSFFDLIILDLLLVEDRGFELCKAVRELVSAPVMLITTIGDDQDVFAGLDTGADDFITRPIRSAEFLARVRAIKTDDLTVDSARLDAAV